MKRVIMLIVVLCVAGFQVKAVAAPTQWKAVDGGTDNWFDVVHYWGNWEQAKTHSEAQFWNGIQGHLATETSQEEQEFIWGNFPYDQCWLGGYQIDKTAEPDGNWAWVTNEPWGYDNFAQGEPNDWGGTEEYLLTWYNNGLWNDATNFYERHDYFLEFSTPASVPEPSTILLVGTALMGFVGLRKSFIRR